MDEDGTFSKIGTSEQRMYGPRGLLVCGMNPEEQRAVYALVANGGIHDLPVVFVTDGMLDMSLGEVLGKENGYGLGGASSCRRAIIMSGFREMELHWMMSSYRQLGLPRPLWATLTPTSESWPVRQLIAELAAEDGAMRH